MDDASNIVARQYTTYCYPEPFNDIEEQIGAGVWYYGDPSLSSALLWPEGRPRKDLRVLVAGCGTVQAAWFAYTNPECSITGVDLSEASLAHQRFLQEKYNLKNLRLFQGDLREVGRMGKEFDLIVSTGVLHHMRDPNEGLRALASVLAARGAMVLMVYGAARRVGVYMLQDVFRRLGLRQQPEDVAFVRKVIEQLPPYHYLHLYRESAPDLAHASGLVDTFLHPQDRAYTVPEVLDFVHRGGLAFQGWLDNFNYYPAGCLLRGSELCDRVEALPLEQQWAIVENLTLLNACHFFAACHPGRSASARIDFSGAEWLGYVPVRHPGLTILEEASAERHGRAKRGPLEWAVSEAEVVLLRGVDGHRTIEQIIAHPCLGHHSMEARSAFAQGVFKRLWELGHLFMAKPAAQTR
jgi:SAM-dependent methyltransferase